MKKTRLNPMSKKKIAEVNGEYDARVELCFRCGGRPHFSTRKIQLNNGELLELKTVTCIGGTCEWCHQPAGNRILHPHEKYPRGKGGKLSLGNSIMIHDYPCHAYAQNNILKWSQKGN